MPVRLATAASNVYRYPLLIRHLLGAPMATAASQEIVYRDQVRHDYGELHRRVARLADALTRAGVVPGMTVAVMDWDSHRYLECFFAIPMLGAVLQTVNVRLAVAQLTYTLKHARAELLLAHRDFLPMLAEIRSDLPDLRRVILIADGSDPVDAPAWVEAEYEEALAGAADGFQFADFDENAVATTFYTTGTTGMPKGVCYSHRQLVLHTLALLGAVASPAHGQSFRQGDVYMPLTPMFHVHAWGNPFVATVLGVKQVYPGRYVCAEILELRRREGVTFSHCVPTVLQMLLEEATRKGHDLSGWKLCVGGSALPPGLAREALGQGIDVFAGYGMSETGPVLAISRMLTPPCAPASDDEIATRCRAGLPMPMVDLRLVDPDGRIITDQGQCGEIMVRAPWLTPCYTEDPSASEALWSGGYLHTQDVARIDSKGYLQITDRMKDVIKTGGEWISSIDLEFVISHHPGVLEVAVIGVVDARWGERPHALVVPKAEAANLAPEDIRLHVSIAIEAGELPRYALPERVSIVSALPRTSVGKIDKRALRESTLTAKSR